MAGSPLDDRTLAILDRLRGRPLARPEPLRAVVRRHLARAREAATAATTVDLLLAEEIGAACEVLLDAWEALDDGGRGEVQAACLYFAESVDDEDDFGSSIGFVDDAEVVNRAAVHVGRPELVIDLS